MPPARDTKQPDKDEHSVLFYSSLLLSVSQFEQNLKALLLYKGNNPSKKREIRILSKDVQANLEDLTMQSFFNIYNALLDPRIFEKYSLQLKIARKLGFDGRGIPQRKY